MRIHPAVLIALSLLAGVGVARSLPGALVSTAHAQEATAWQCYVVDRLEDPKKAADWKGAKVVTEGLNAIAPSTPAGTILSVQYPTTASFASNQGDVSMLCLK